MAIKDIFKVSRKTFFNPSGWLDYDSLKLQTSTISGIIASILTPVKPQVQETFEQATKRLHLQEKDLGDIQSRYRSFALLFLLAAIISFGYSFFLLFNYQSFLGLLLGLGVTALFLAYAFRFDFWSYQIRRRKLGITFDEWLSSILGSKGKSS